MVEIFSSAVAGKILRIVLVLIGSYIARLTTIRFINLGLKTLDYGVTPKAKEERARTLGSVLANLAHFAIGIAALLIILSEFGVNVAPLIAGLGVLGLGVGLAAQTLIKDYISGFFILFEDQFNVGDEIEVANKRGIVKELSLRFTILADSEGKTYFIPNNQILSVTKFKK